MIAGEARMTFNPMDKTVNLQRKRATDIKQNSRVYLPTAIGVIQESKLSVRCDTVTGTGKFVTILK